MAETFEEVERAFHRVIEARAQKGGAGNDPEELTRLCGGDSRVAEEVRSLLRHMEAVEAPSDPGRTKLIDSSTSRSGFLDPAELHPRLRSDAPSPQSLLDDWGAAPIGQRVGEFTLIGPCGAGGMGVVFIAEQEHPRRTVALKLVRRQAATDALVRRFEREAQLLGRLNHPGIAQVYAAGVANLVTAANTVARVPYIAMELVDGPNLLEFVKKRSFDVTLVLQLIAQVCDAVQHAHVRGVIHRDLKPSNILVAVGADGVPQVKVLDFGVARQRDDDAPPGEDPETQVTAYGGIVGTLAYMSPEQISGNSDVDARSDVYAIGAILYQLLANELPLDVRSCPLPEAARRIAERQPPALGTKDRAFRGDIETMVATALEKEPARRYQSPAVMALDIRHHLAHEPIQARRDSLIYVMSKRAARYQTLAYAIAALLVVVAAAAIYSRQQQRVSKAAEKAAIAAHLQASAAQLESERAAARLAKELSASRIDQGRLLGAAGDLTGAERLLWDEYLAHPESRAARWALWQLYSRSGCLRTLSAHAGECRTMALAPDGQRFATGGDESIARIWSIPNGERLAEIDTGLVGVRAIAYSRDGGRLAVAGEGGAVLIDLTTGARRSIAQAKVAQGVDFASNDLAIAVGSDDGSVRLFDSANGTLLTEISPQDESRPVAVRAVRFDTARAHLSAAYEDGTVRLWKLSLARGSASTELVPGVTGRPGTTGYGVDFSPDGALLASGSSDRTLTLWRVSDGARVATWETKNGSARSAAFSPDGRLVAVPGFWRTQIFDVVSGKSASPPSMPALGDGGSYAAAFTPDGKLLIATGPEGTCRLWDLTADPTTVFGSTSSPVRDLSLVRSGGECWLASVQRDGAVRVRSMPIPSGTGGWRDVMSCNAGDRAQTVALTSDAAQCIIGRGDGHIVTLDARTGRILQDLPAHSEGVNFVRLTPDSRTLVSGGTDDVVRIWQRRADGIGWDEGVILKCGGDVIGGAIRPDGQQLAITARPEKMQFWELPGGRSLGQIDLREMPWRLAYSPDSRRLAVGSWNRSVQVWQVTGGSPPVQLSESLLGHAQLVMNEAFDESGELLASVSNDASLRIWDVSSQAMQDGAGQHASQRRSLLTLDAGAGDTLAVAFLPDRPDGGKSVAVGHYDGTVRIWDLAFFNRHLEGQAGYQRQLRASPSTRSIQ